MIMNSIEKYNRIMEKKMKFRSSFIFLSLFNYIPLKDNKLKEREKNKYSNLIQTKNLWNQMSHPNMQILCTFTVKSFVPFLILKTR